MSPSPVIGAHGPLRFRTRGSLADLGVGPSLSFVPEQDEVMEGVEAAGDGSGTKAPPSISAADAAACRGEALWQSLNLAPTDVAICALIDKVEASSLVSSICSHMPADFKGAIVDFVKKYHADVLRLGTVATHFAKLRQHTAHGTFPTALHLIRVPQIQWSHKFMAAPQSSRQNFAEGSSTRNAAFTSFTEAVSIEVTTVKENILKGWIAEKVKELALFKSAAAADTGISNLRDAIEERMGDLCSRFTYDVVGGRPLDIVPARIQEILAGRIFQQEVLYRVAPTIIGKVNSLVHNTEDRCLQDTLKRMDLSTAAPRLSSETRKNDVDALAKKVADLAKKIGGKKKGC